MTEALERALKDRIDDYQTTVITILAFMSLYKYDKESGGYREEVKIYQGRRMKSLPSADEVTPDIVIQIGAECGTIAEVKLGLPQNQDYWAHMFEQLQKYDTEMVNWATDSGKITTHDISLLVEISRAYAVKKFFLEKMNSHDILFKRNFFILEFSRADQRNQYLFIRTSYGSPPAIYSLEDTLAEGKKIPLKTLIDKFSKAKIYDCEPPRAYLMHLIYELYISQMLLSQDDLAGVRRGKRIPVRTSVNQICEFLREFYSFKTIDSDCERFQPYVPRADWVRRAIDAFRLLNLSDWEDETTGTCRIYYKRGFDLNKLEKLCVEHNIDVTELTQTALDI